MNSDKVAIVILLVVGIVVLSNIMMFAMVRGMRGMNFKWLSRSRETLSQPFQKEDDSLDELRRAVGGLSDPTQGEEGK
jgi:hypothetical protein